MLILCHKPARKHLLFSKSFSQIFVAFLLVAAISSGPLRASAAGDDRDFGGYYQSALQSIYTGHFNQARNDLEAARRSAGDDQAEQRLYRHGRALLGCAQALDLEQKLHADMIRQRRDFLYFTLFIIIFGLFMGYLLRYGKKRPAFVEQVDVWVQRGRARSEKGIEAQAGTAILSMIIYAFVALLLLLVVLGFIWVLKTVTPPTSGQFEQALPIYEEALEQLKLSRADAGYDPDKSDLLKVYKKFLEERQGRDI